MMGFFDSPEDKIRKKLPAADQQRAQEILDFVERNGSHLPYHKMREVRYLAFAGWLQAEAGRRREIIASLSPLQLANFVDVGARMGNHFTREQSALWDDAARFTKANPDKFYPGSTN
ncbi:hypothetical protein [Brevundimonas sp.]|uniref:hypothetical protein n=1 Tax=Brevundimonas sp. TaxID=1871086 RepID=UPI00289E99BC|nr:hypothetical protein [Brevundimonas sp.]